MGQSSTQHIGIYTIEQIRTARDLSDEDFKWLTITAMAVCAEYGNKFSWEKFSCEQYVKTGAILLCRREGKPVGLLLMRVMTSVFDNKTKILTHDLLYAEPGTRAAHILFNAYVDFGRRTVDHVTMTIAEHTNIKPRSLEREGFVKLQTVFRLEV